MVPVAWPSRDSRCTTACTRAIDRITATRITPRRLDGPAPDFEIRDLTELVTLLERAHRLRGLGRVRSIRHARRSAG
jgi:hypothetical protein